MLRNALKRRIDQSVANTQTSVSAEVLDTPRRMPDGTYQVSVGLLGGGYGGLSKLVVLFSENTSGVTGNSLKAGDLVLVSFDEKGYFAPRITGIISRETAFKNNQIRKRPTTADTQRTENTQAMTV